MTTPEGQTYIIARGPSLRAGEPLRFALTGLPHHSRWPVAVALGLAGLVIVAGVWLAWSRVRTADTARRDALFARREQLLGTLVALERERRDGFVDGERFGARRSELVRSLERVYGELDSGPGNLVREEGPPR
jgi:hypothetical protein